MPTLKPEFEIGGEYGATDPAMRGRAVYAAGFSGPAAHRLILNGATTAQFDAALKEACEMRSIVRMCAPQLAFTGVDPEAGIDDTIRRGIPLADLRKQLIDLLAEHDADTHTETARRLPASGVSAQTTDVYAQRTAQIDAQNAAQRTNHD
jgi:hypothetical protein